MLSYLTDNWELWVEGFQNTVTLTALSFVIGFFVAVPIGLARTKPDTILARIAYVYIYIIRGTPLLAQIFIVYYGFG